MTRFVVLEGVEFHRKESFEGDDRDVSVEAGALIGRGHPGEGRGIHPYEIDGWEAGIALPVEASRHGIEGFGKAEGEHERFGLRFVRTGADPIDVPREAGVAMMRHGPAAGEE